MLAAQIHGKLKREEEDLEDLLTSNVFGSIQYIPPEDGLVPILSAAERADGSQPLRELSEIFEVNYYFWRRLEFSNCYPCVPDVLICIKHINGKKTVVLVEAKYHSGKSSVEENDAFPTDQLAREWDNLVVLAKENAANPYLFYVTADITCPNADIKEAQSELARKRGFKAEIIWISWRKLPVIFHDSSHKILKDLVKVLRRQWLIFFEGISVPDHIETIKWHFQGQPLQLNWSICIPAFQWKYDGIMSIQLNWGSFEGIIIRWRFIK